MPRNSNRTIKATFILLTLLLGACAKQLTTDERLVMITRLSPTPTPAATQAQTITGKVVGANGDRADRRQPQQQDLSPAELPGLLEGRGA